MANRFWVGNGGNWSGTTHWSATSGGANGASEPTSTDDVFFDANSFTLPGQTITVDPAARSCRDLNFTGVTNAPTVGGTASQFNIYGSFILASSVLWTFTGSIYLRGTAGPYTINQAGVTINSIQGFNIGATIGSTAIFNLLSNLIFGIGCSIEISNGCTFNASTFNVTCDVLIIEGTCVVNMGSGTWRLIGGSAATIIGLDTPTVNAQTSTLIFDLSFSSNYDTGDNVFVFNIVQQINGTFIYFYSSLSAASYSIDSGQMQINDSLVISVNTFTATGGRIRSMNPGTPFILSATNPVDVSGLSVADCTGAGSIPFYDFPDGADETGNTNWLFTERPPTTTTLSQTGTLTEGGSYAVGANIGGSNGTVTICLDNGTCQTFPAGAGNVSFDGTWNLGDGNIVTITPSADFDGTVTDVSVQLITPVISNPDNFGIDSAYDFQSQSGVKNLRKWGPNLEVRNVNPTTSEVTWINILSTLIETNVARFTEFWNATELKLVCLFCNGAQTVYEWSGAVGYFLSASNASGIIGSITAEPATNGSGDSGGTGYVPGDVLTVTGGDGTAQLTVLAVAPGGIATVSIADGGTGYMLDDIIRITVNPGGRPAYLKVTGVAGDVVTSVAILTSGTGYNVATAVVTTDTTTGGAAGLLINILTVGNAITAWTIANNGTGYSTGNNNATTGGTGTGASVQIVSVATNSITLSGTKTLAQLGFYDTSGNAAKFQLLINGATYTYTGSNANGGFTFVGITVDPTAQGFAVGDAVIQKPVTGATTGATNFLPANFNVDLISTLGNQVWYGDLKSNNVYASAAADYVDLGFSSPRRPTEGIVVTLDAPPIGFKPQSNQASSNSNSMYIAAGQDQWYAIGFDTSLLNSANSVISQAITIQRLKTTPLQGAQSQELMADFKNTIAFVSNEPILNEFGISPNFFAEPQMENISDSIKYDMDAYDFAGGQVFYWNYYLFFTVPVLGVVRMYNVVKKYWEAPQLLPIARFYLVDGQLYGHSSLTNESYQLFTGYNDNGNPINAIAAFPYVATIEGAGGPADLKTFNHSYTEGYIAGNTEILLTINYDFGGFTGTYGVAISGQAPSPIIFNKVTDGSLGQNTLGSQPIGAILNLGAQPAVPKFRVINTMPKHDFYESQIVYSSNDIDQQWTLLRFGQLVQPSVNKPAAITL